MKQLAVTQRLFQALLDHYWKSREQEVPPISARYPKGYCVSYGDLIGLADIALEPRRAAGPLHVIAAFCNSHYGVPLHALVVNNRTGVPGGALDFRKKGYYAAPGSSADLNGWREVDVPKCIAASHLPRIAPPLAPDLDVAAN